MHARQKVTREARPKRQTQVQAPKPHQDHIRSLEGMEPSRNPLRNMAESVPISHRTRRDFQAPKFNEPRV